MRTYVVKDKKTGEIIASCLNVNFALKLLNKDMVNRICLVVIDNKIVSTKIA